MSDDNREAPTDQDGRTGQVAEIGNLDPADSDTPVSDDQSVAGSPSDEAGQVDEGPTGPNSRAGSNRN